jgi:hypothetical protein
METATSTSSRRLCKTHFAACSSWTMGAARQPSCTDLDAVSFAGRSPVPPAQLAQDTPRAERTEVHCGDQRAAPASAGLAVLTPLPPHRSGQDLSEETCGRPIRLLISDSGRGYGAFMDPAGANRWQPATNAQTPEKRLKHGKTVATCCDQLPIGPEEGFARHAGSSRGCRRLRRLSLCQFPRHTSCVVALPALSR